MFNNLKAEIEAITAGERFVDTDTINAVMEIPGLHLENCGASGTGKGTLWTAYTDDGEEIADMVELYDWQPEQPLA